MRSQLVWPLLLLLATACGQRESAEVRAVPAEAPPVLPEPTYTSTVARELSLEMDDGVRLGGTVTFPSLDGSALAPGKFPMVLSMTPYSRLGVCGN